MFLSAWGGTVASLMPSKRPPFSVNLPLTMEAFLDQLVKDGRAANPREALRGLIWQEMKRWRREHGKAFPSHEDEKPSGGGAEKE